jgi:hypothetical protein
MSAPNIMTTDPSHESILRDLLARYPGLQAHLKHLCDVWDRQGIPPARLALGQGLTRHGELAALRQVFGSAVQVSRSGRATLDVRAFLSGFVDSGAESWTAALYRAMDRRPRDRATEREQQAASFETLLAEWQQAYPAVAAAASVIAARPSWWQSQIRDTSVAAVRSEWAQWGEALSTLAPAAAAVGLAELGARCYGNSKALRAAETRRFLAAGLAALEGIDEAAFEPTDILRRFGVCDNPTALKVTVFGPLRLRKRGRWLDWVAELHALGEAATLSLGNLDGVEAVDLPGDATPVHTCENETPFCRLVRERFQGTLVYTEGYPNSAVRRLLELLLPGVGLRHWGDSDLDGLRIAALLGDTRPVQLWRCSLPDLERHRAALVPLTAQQDRRARQWLENQPGFRFRAELEFTLAHGWLEQESWQHA